MQRKRSKGWRTPENTVYVGRPGKWSNPYTLRDHTREEAVALYREHVRGREAEIVAELRGRNLSCWCAVGEPCHADVLIEIANGYPPGQP